MKKSINEIFDGTEPGMLGDSVERMRTKRVKRSTVARIQRKVTGKKNPVWDQSRSVIPAVSVFACFIIAGIVAASVLLSRGTSSTGPDPGNENSNGFIIEDGTLVKYVGDDSSVVIPENVTRITRTAFAGYDETSSIVSLTLGKNVQEVEPLALSPISGLSTISVDPENDHYMVRDNYLIKKDGAFVFASIGSDRGKTADIFFAEALEILNNDALISRRADSVRIEIGPAEILVRKDGDQGMYSSNLIESVSCFGKTVPFPQNAGSVFDASDGKFQAFQTDQYFVTGIARDDGSGAVYFITDNSLIKVQMPFDDADEEYNRSAVSFYCENGELLYTRQPVKYFCPDKSAGGIVEKCLSRDELFSESGRVIILDDKIEFDPLETVTVSEATDLENEFSAWSRAQDLDPEMTLDDYLELNGRLFGRARDSEENAPRSNGLSFMIKQDGTVIIPSIGADDGNNADMVLIEAMGIIESGCYDFPEGVSYSLAVGKAMIELDSSAVAGTDQTSFTVRSVSYGDNTVSSVTDPDGEEIRINGNLRFQAFDTEECFVLGYMNSSGAGMVYLIGGESSIKTVMPLEDTNALYNRTVISFYSRSGKLLYRRQPQKYYQSPQVQGEKIEKCVSRDELYCEYGTAVIEGRKVVYNPVLSKSVSEALDLEEEYSLYRKARNTSGNGVSLDDFLKSNLETYESYEIIE